MNKKSLAMAVAGVAGGLLAVALAFAIPVNSKAGSTTIVVDSGAINDAGSFTFALQEALDEAAANATSSDKYIVKISEGNYTLERPLHIYSNTTLDATGSTIKASVECENMLYTGMLYNGYDASYSVFRNIKIKGGTWDANGKKKYTAAKNAGTIGDAVNHPLFRFAHTTNLEMTGVTLKDPFQAHHVEVAAMDKFKVTKCKFIGITISNTEREALEALQLDICNSRFLGYYSGGKELACKNVTISGCEFNKVVRGIGSHRTSADGVYYQNVKIYNNKITVGNKLNRKPNQELFCIEMMMWKNAKLYGNTLSGATTAIYVENKNPGTVIGGKKANIIKNAKKYGIHINKSSVKEISKNKISKVTLTGININHAKVTTVKNNKLSKCKHFGISVTDNTKLKKISGNKCSGCGHDNRIWVAPDTKR